MEDALTPTADPAWVLVEDGFDPLRESNRATRFAISNGFLGVRGASAITGRAHLAVPPRTYVAGLFDTPAAEPSVPGLVPAADWLRADILLPEGPRVCDPCEVSSLGMTLDMRRGAVLSECRQSNGAASIVRLRTLRLVSQAERAIGLQLIQLEVEEGEGEITLEASLEGLDLGLLSERLQPDLGVWRTKSSGKSLAMAIAVSLQLDGQEVPPTALDQFRWSWTWASRPGQVACFQRLVSLVRSDTPGLDPGGGARERLGDARKLGWRGVVAAHEAAWLDRWRRSEIEVEGDPAAQRALRFALYHLVSAANPGDDHVSIGARALTGDDYLGHVFWDTEIFLLPFYILTWPEAARALLMYRFHTLDAARAKASRMGWRGALYAWESADTGDEATPDQVVGPDRQVVDVLSGREEQHVSADVAYAVWQYWQSTGDEGFLLVAGAEILLETGRFWASRAQMEADGLGHIRGVIGPDEYHEHVDDNAFTNVMARWNIRRALEVAALLRGRWPARWEELAGRLALDDAELEVWRATAQSMATGLDPKTGLFEQFAGYFALEDIDLTAYQGRSVPMDVVLGRERTRGSQVVKQADVVALLGLLPEEFAGRTGADNFRYYEPRCGHGSSLSPAMHGLVAARLGDVEMALSYFRRAAAIDLADTHVAIAGGVHIATQGGLWQLVVFGFAGLSLRDDGLAFAPRLPAGWGSLGFGLQWRGRHLRIRFGPGDTGLEATLDSGDPMSLVVDGVLHDLSRDRPLRTAPQDQGDRSRLDIAAIEAS